MVHKTGQMGVPVIEIDGDVVVGYDEKLAQGKTGALVQGVEPCLNR